MIKNTQENEKLIACLAEKLDIEDQNKILMLKMHQLQIELEKTCIQNKLLQDTINVFEKKGAAFMNEKAEEIKIIKLNLGSGGASLPGYINVDIVQDRLGVVPDVICDIRNLEVFENNYADEILSVHVIEHFWRWEVLDIVKEWVRVLKPGGKMIIECPNLITACEEVLKDPNHAVGTGKEVQRTMWCLYGDPAHKDPLMCHRWLYTPVSLAQLMHEAGLVDLKREPALFKMRDPRDMRIVGFKKS